MSIVSIAILLLLTITFLLSVSLYKSAEKREIKQAIRECYETSLQCGLHNALEEGDLTDTNLDMMIITIRASKDLSEDDIEKGIRIAEYLKTLIEHERESFICEAVHDE